MSNLRLGNTTTHEVSDVAKLKTLNIKAGNYVKTVSYTADYLTSATPASGGSLYEITTLNLYRVKIADGAWVPDGTIDFYLNNGNIAVDVLTGYESLVDSINNLKDLPKNPLKDGVKYSTKGYTTPYDGGHGDYYWDADASNTADDFKYIQLNEGGVGRFILQPYAGRYNVLQGGVTRDGVATATRVQAVFDALVDGDKLDWPPIIGTNFYNLDGIIELKDLDNIDMTGAGIEDLAVAGQVAPIKYTGPTVTGLGNAVFKIMGLSYSQVRNFFVDADNKADYGIWWSGCNGGTMPAGVTGTKRSTNCTFEESHARGANVSGIVVGYGTGFSPQTDVLNMIRVRSSTTETGAAVDSTPVTRGFEIRGLNTYVDLLHCEATGDCGYYTTGNANFTFCYSLNNDVAGWYNVSANTMCNLTKCYMEGLVGRPIQFTQDSQATARTWTVINLQAFPSGGTQYPCKFANNQPVSMIGCMMDGWVTDNYASGHERPVYVSLGNKFFTPVDYSNRSDIALVQLDVGAGVAQKDIKKYFHGLKSTVADESGSSSVVPEGAAFHDVIVVDGSGGNTATLPNTVKGTRIRFHRNGTGTLVVNAKAGDSIIRHDTNTAVVTDVRLSTGSEFGYIEFYCVEENEWRCSSMLTITYN